MLQALILFDSSNYTHLCCRSARTLGRPADERRIDRIFLSSRAKSFVSHSQITDTRQPSFLSSFVLFLSRSTFSLNFFCQKLTRLFGEYANLQARWRCQKQPWTKMRRRRRETTMSGFPGSFSGYVLKRHPSRRSAERTSFSGRVFWELMRDMFQLRRSFERVSMGITSHECCPS